MVDISDSFSVPVYVKVHRVKVVRANLFRNFFYGLLLLKQLDDLNKERFVSYFTRNAFFF